MNKDWKQRVREQIAKQPSPRPPMFAASIAVSALLEALVDKGVFTADDQAAFSALLAEAMRPPS